MNPLVESLARSQRLVRKTHIGELQCLRKHSSARAAENQKKTSLRLRSLLEGRGELGSLAGSASGAALSLPRPQTGHER